VSNDSEAKDGKEASRMQAMGALLDGRGKIAVRKYSQHTQEYPDDRLAWFERACAESAYLPLADAGEAMDLLQGKDHSPSESARLAVARAYIKQRRDNGADITPDLILAAKLDPVFALAHLSLGRQLLFTKPNDVSAREHLDRAAALAPSAVGPRLGLVGLGAQTDDYSGAAREALALVKDHPFSGRGWLSLLSSSVLSSPFTGRVFLVGMAIATFVPYLGPYMLVCWFAFAFLSLFALKRYSPRLAVYPAFVVAVLLIVYLVRSVVLGHLFP
jgi:hypothetical protein